MVFMHTCIESSLSLIVNDLQIIESGHIGFLVLRKCAVFWNLWKNIFAISSFWYMVNFVLKNHSKLGLRDFGEPDSETLTSDTW